MNIYLKVHGCSNNVAEAEMMLGLLKKAGFEAVNTPADASVIILSICSVKRPSINTALKEIEYFSKEYPHKKLIIAGCIPKQLIPIIRETADVSLINTHNIRKIVEVVEETINDNLVEVMAYEKEPKIALPRLRKNKVISIIPISNSCTNQCSFCNTRLIKGSFYSYPVEEIIKEVKESVEQGCREIWITSQDNACYNLDKHDDKEKVLLPELLNKVCRKAGDFRVRVGMMNPKNVLPILDELIEAFKHEKMFKFLHLPVQSGSDRILELMKRGYKAEDFKKIVNRFREAIPEITISTDVIAGFPTETEEEFRQTVELIKEIKPDVLNRSRFWSHEGTEAAKLEQVHGKETKKRSSHITSVFDYVAFENNKKWKNWEGYILIEEKGKDNSFVGRNPSYKPVVVMGEFEVGDKVKVRIRKITVHYLIAEVMQ
tara:strand:- start:2407 stop:3699 length:1293 start_codon:yes stop_codon:yes gene_type:complete